MVSLKPKVPVRVMNLLKPIRLVRVISNYNPRFSASQSEYEPHKQNASQRAIEPHMNSASHIRAKTHSGSASQPTI